MESYARVGGRGLKNLMYAYMGVEGVKNGQNHPYVINEWSLSGPTTKEFNTGLKYQNFITLSQDPITYYGSPCPHLGLTLLDQYSIKRSEENSTL